MDSKLIYKTFDHVKKYYSYSRVGLAFIRLLNVLYNEVVGTVSIGRFGNIHIVTKKKLWDEIIEISKQTKGIKEGTIKNDFIKPTGGEVILEKGDRISLGSVGRLFPLTKNVYKYYFEGYEESKYVVKINVE